MGAHARSGDLKLWEGVVAGLDRLLDDLPDCARRLRRAHPTIPQRPGIYLFSESGKRMYVGQTRNVNKRLANHTNAGSQQNQAKFAFLLALEDADRVRVPTDGTRRETARDPAFVPLFDAAKARVRAMDVQFALSDNPELRTVFEVYAALQLPTQYNSFETH